MSILLTPPVAFLIYVALVIVLYGFGRVLAPATRRSTAKSSLYAGGEVAATSKAAPGYRRFFIVALFFAVLHLGALVLATAGLAGGAGGLVAALWPALLFYLGGLAVALLILLLS
jgi:NADH:ubiquinone oxidoreductase subunit 3 (subunit A)